MSNGSKLGPLQVVLVVVGIIFVVGIYPLTIIWPSGWAWHMGGPSMYLQMILGIYATLGVFLLLAARNPLKHLSLISYAVFCLKKQNGIMAAQALFYPEHRVHLLGDVPALLLIAIVLALPTSRAAKAGA